MRNTAAPSFFLATLSALPPPAATLPSLIPRADASESTSGSTDPARPGTLHCFNTGTAINITFLIDPVSLTSVKTPISRVCNASSHLPNSAPNTLSFDYKPTNANGTYIHQHINGSLSCSVAQMLSGGLQDCELGRQSEALKFDAMLMGPSHASQVDCEFAMGKIVDGCLVALEDEDGDGTWDLGTEPATRGGWWEFGDDGSSYGLDPGGDFDGRVGK